MTMLRFFIKLGRQNKFLQKHVFSQAKRTYSKKDTSDTLIPKKESSSPDIISKVKDGLSSIKGSIAAKDCDEILVDWMQRPQLIPQECDVIIIGGGAMGSSIAYWLKKRVHSDAFKIIVVERDPTYTAASTVLSLGGLRQQFSLKENIEMSLFGAEFIRNINYYLGVEGEPPIDPCFHPYGYLMLASENGAETLTQNSKLQNFLGAKNILLSAAKLKDMFPWLNTDDVELGCLGLEKEGWFDPWILLSAFKRKALILGAEYISGEAQGFNYKSGLNDTERLDSLIVKTKDGETHDIKFAVAIVAAGAFSGDVARMAKIGTERGLREVCLPVEPRKRGLYCVHVPDGPTMNTPLTVDSSGAHFRREGLANTYICAMSPEESEEPSVENLEVDYNFFEEKIWPLLAHRVPAFEKLKLKSSWAGFYEYNTFDQNGIIGSHPYYQNLLFATGFSGHGIQQSPAVGRAIAEYIIDGEYKTIDLRNLGFNRFIDYAPAREINVL